MRDGGGIFGAAIQFTGGACVVLDNEQCTFALQKYFLQTKKSVKNILYFILRLGIYANYISFIYK
jgi:hypothetical protein